MSWANAGAAASIRAAMATIAANKIIFHMYSLLSFVLFLERSRSQAWTLISGEQRPSAPRPKTVTFLGIPPLSDPTLPPGFGWGASDACELAWVFGNARRRTTRVYRGARRIIREDYPGEED